MKEIKLTQGKIALVDDEDFEYLNQWKWCAGKMRHSFYATKAIIINGKRTSQSMHRLIMKINDPKIFVDHKDHDGLNNQKTNLRLATQSQNGANRRTSKKSISKYLGVYANNKNWTAKITFNKKLYYLGTFKTEIQAAIIYDEAAKIHHGEFANLNFK